METVKGMTVADAIAILLEMDPNMELVTPQAPDGHPSLVTEGFINVMTIDYPDSDFEELSGDYCGIGFPESAIYDFMESDYTEDDLEEVEEEIEKEAEPEVWHDKFVPKSVEELRNIVASLDDDEGEFDDSDGYDDSGGEDD